MIHIRVLSLAALAAVLAVPLAAGAQQTPLPAPAGAAAPAHHHHGNRFLHAVHALHLSPAQRQQIDGLAARSHQTNRNVDKATRRANQKQLRTQIEAILTQGQRTQLHAAMKRQHPKAAPVR